MTTRLATHPEVAHRWPGVRAALQAARSASGGVAVDVEDEPTVVGRLRAVLPSEADLIMVGLTTLRRPDPEGWLVVAVPPRGDARDVLLTARSGSSLQSLHVGARVGVEGGRRAAFLAAHRQDLVAVPRSTAEAVDEVLAGRLDAAIVAVEMARSLETGDLGMEILDPRAWLPEAGQGIVALMSKGPLAGAAALDHAATRIALRAELALLGALDGSGGVLDGSGGRYDGLPGASAGASTGPATGAWAQVSGRSIRLRAAIASSDGRHLVRADVTGSAEEPEVLGGALARLLFERGASELLAPTSR